MSAFSISCHRLIAGPLIELERHVPHAQARVPALLNVSLRPPKPADQEISQPFLGAVKVLGRIHWSEDVVGGHFRVKRRHQPGKAFLANLPVNLTF